MKNQKPIVIEIARPHKDLPESRIDEIVSSYNPTHHEAPITLGHPKDDSPSWGWIKKLMKVGKLLYAEIDPVPELEKWLKEKRYKKRSIAIYPPDKERSTYSLRHVAFLGGTPPRIKGMKDYVFDDGDCEIVSVEFSEDDNDFSEEEKEKTIMEKDVVTYSEDQHTRLVEAAVQSKENELTQTFSEERDGLKDEIKALEEKNTELEEKVNEFAEKAVKAETEAFVDSLIKDGKLAPAEKEETVELFSEASEPLRKKLKNSYSKRKVVTFGEDDSLNEDEDKEAGKKKIDADASVFGNSKEDVEKFADMETFSLV